MVELLLKKPPSRILVINLRNLGDVILTTPLVTSLRKHYPNAKIDFLAFSNTAAILENNPDIYQVIAVPQKPSFSEYKQIVKRIFRRYDLSVVAQTADRPFLFSLLSSSTRIGLVPERPQQGWWKRYFFRRWTEARSEVTHTVLQNLQIMDIIPGKKYYGLTPPRIDGKTAFELHTGLARDYVVLHICARYRYKHWPRREWKRIVEFMAEQGLQIVLTGGPGPEELRYISEFQQSISIDMLNLAGQTSLAELSEIISGARLFVGVDTGTTHQAAATGVPVVAIFGPTNPIMWAPWPAEYNSDSVPFAKIGSGTVSNVHLVQGRKFCVPCQEEGCDRHRKSRSECLDTLDAERVIRRIRAILDNTGDTIAR